MAELNVLIIDPHTRAEWREWLRLNHDSIAAIWLVFHKRHTGIDAIEYEDAINEALCWGWVDSLVRRLDDDRYARKFTPRKRDSRWSTSNRQRYEILKQHGELKPSGIARAPTARSGDAPRPLLTSLPTVLETALRENARARRSFDQMPPSHKRAYVAWIQAAKREETRQRRLAEAVKLLAAGKTLGMK